MIRRLIYLLKTNIKIHGLFHGIRNVLITAFYRRLTDSVIADYVYEKTSFHYIEKFYKKHKTDYNLPCPSNDIGENEFVYWTCWLQGIDTAPPLVKACIKSAERYTAGRRIIIITYENLEKYVSLPDFILEKHKKGFIHFPAFTNIIRTYLLYFYGGLWFDSTVFFTQPIPQELLKENIFFFRCNLEEKFSPWSSWFIISPRRKNALIYRLLCSLLEYWRINNKYYAYFIFHYFLQAIINNEPELASVYNKVPYRSNQNPHFLQLRLLFSEFDEELWEKVKNVSFCHKLTFKIPAEKKELNNSFFSYICKQFDL